MLRRKLLSVATIALVSMAAMQATAGEEETTPRDVEQARRCASETRHAGYAFADVRDSVRVGDKARAQSQLDAAEDALLSARSACRGNAEVSEQLDALTGDAEALRRALR